MKNSLNNMIKILYKNKEYRKILKLNKSFLSQKIDASYFLEICNVEHMNSKDSVFYLTFNEEIKLNGAKSSLFKLEEKKKELSAVSNGQKSLSRAVLVDYTLNHDRNISLDFGNFQYI